MSSIAQLIATGEAWNETGSRREAAPVEPDAPLPRALPSVVPVPAQAGPRVQLGFRDGTTASLDPDSEQALALAELSELLSARD